MAKPPRLVASPHQNAGPLTRLVARGIIVPVMKKRLFHYILRLCIRILSGSAVLARGVGFFIGGLSRSTLRFFNFCVPLGFFCYLAIRRLKIRFRHFIEPLKGRAFYVFSHRYFVHALVAGIVFVAITPSLRASGVGAVDSQFLLSQLATNEEAREQIIDDIIPSSEEMESYLEGLFQDQPLFKIEQGLPLTLEEGALLRQDLPGARALPTRSEIVEYEVLPGDTIWDTAEQFNVSVSTILWENRLTLYSTIRPGQKLTILPVSGVSHIVKKGETLGAIVGKYKASIDEIIEVNKLADAGTALKPGTKIAIPGGRPYVVPSQPSSGRREITAPPSRLVASGGKFLWPTISKYITQYFKWRHVGLDIGDKTGNPIYACESGIVEFAGWGSGGWGNTIIINHGNGLKIRYAHASKIFVKVGQQINKGQSIALIGSTGRSTGPHLHLGVYVNGRPVNPLEYLR